MPSRRTPTQLRALLTVDSILDAVLAVLRREGLHAVTTNRVAEVAGVSIGSLYQYFPNKQALFLALHQRHIEQIDRIVHTALARHTTSPLDQLVRSLVDALTEAHLTDPDLYPVLASQVPHHPGGSQPFAARLYPALLQALSSHAAELRPSLETAAFLFSHLLDSLTHAVALHRPEHLSLAEARDEAARALLSCLRS